MSQMGLLGASCTTPRRAKATAQSKTSIVGREWDAAESESDDGVAGVGAATRSTLALCAVDVSSAQWTSASTACDS